MTFQKITTNAKGLVTSSSSVSSGDITSALGFTPVQQSGGGGQSNNKIYIGWLGSQLGVQVDSTNFGATWPINISGSAGSSVGAGTYRAVNHGNGVNYTNSSSQTITVIFSGVDAGGANGGVLSVLDCAPLLGVHIGDLESELVLRLGNGARINDYEVYYSKRASFAFKIVEGRVAAMALGLP